MKSALPVQRHICRVLLALIVLPWSAFGYPLPSNATEVANATPSVLIEEVAWGGSTLSAADEWIELANLGSTTATIGGWRLDGAASAPIFLPPDASIAPYGTYRIANYPETDARSALAVMVQLATTTISLSNSALGIELVDTSDIVIDRAGDGRAPLAGSSSPHITMIRSATSSGDLASSWIAATSSIGFKADVTDFGAPGACHLCTPTDVSVPSIEIELLEEPIESMPEETTTSASSTDSEMISTTSTDPLPTATTTTVTVEPTTSPSSTALSVTITPPPPPLHVTLNEAMSNPAAGPEWVELRIDSITATATDRTLELWDSAGRFMTIPAQTAFTAPGFLLVPLASARLNNGGDDLSLRETNGIVLDLTRLPSLKDGVTWARQTSGSWAQTDRVTPGGPNVFPEPTTTTTASSATTTGVVLGATTSTVTQRSTTTTTTTTTPIVHSGPLLRILLNEVMSNPDGGKEWVELRIEDVAATTTDRALELWDASGRIAAIPAAATIPSPGVLLVTLASSRLNNSGDALSLREAGGEIAIDTTEIPALAKGISWARDDAGGWTDTDTPTPGAPNNLAAEASAPIEETEQTEEMAATKTQTVSSSSFTSFETMLPQEPVVSARVRLVGTVGSVPKLLGATHAFILLGEDGRGAIIYLPKHLHTPVLGNTVRVMGTLTATERQLELRMKTTDVWMTIATSTPPTPRETDFLAPGTEDAWGLVAVTGTVTTIGTKNVVLDVDGVDVTVSMPTASAYRAKRLTKGDIVHVTGLLDPRKEETTILIRTPDDVVILTHAPNSVTAPTAETKHSGLPDWTPFGAAAGAVAATGGLQRLRTFLRRRKLEVMAGKAG